jgi:deazaflavin-dependent oxidoreductase (nitroreductase family)
MSERNDFNSQIIDEFRANKGIVGGPFEGTKLLLLTSIGAKSGQPRISPLAYVMDGDKYVLIASKGGAPTNPDWYFNLKANPDATIELGAETIKGTAVEATGSERDRLYAKMVEVLPGFADYERNTTRTIPVFTVRAAT